MRTTFSSKVSFAFYYELLFCGKNYGRVELVGLIQKAPPIGSGKPVLYNMLVLKEGIFQIQRCL